MLNTYVYLRTLRLMPIFAISNITITKTWGQHDKFCNKNMKANEKRYNIVAETNPYLANRLAEFNGKCRVVKEENLTLKEAQEELLRMYNKTFEDERPYAYNWGLAVIQSQRQVDGAFRTCSDGTRTFEYDSRRYRIEEVENID